MNIENIITETDCHIDLQRILLQDLFEKYGVAKSFIAYESIMATMPSNRDKVFEPQYTQLMKEKYLKVYKLVEKQLGGKYE